MKSRRVGPRMDMRVSLISVAARAGQLQPGLTDKKFLALDRKRSDQCGAVREPRPRQSIDAL